jgi:hypothetical protein
MGTKDKIVDKVLMSKDGGLDGMVEDIARNLK